MSPHTHIRGRTLRAPSVRASATPRSSMPTPAPPGLLARRTPAASFLAILALCAVVLLSVFGIAPSRALAQETTVTFDTTTYGPTMRAQTTTNSMPATVPSTSPGTTYSTDQGTTAVQPSGTMQALTAQQPAATAPISSSTYYGDTTSAPIPYSSNPQVTLMSTGGISLKAIVLGTAVTLVSGASILYATLRKLRAGGGS